MARYAAFAIACVLLAAPALARGQAAGIRRIASKHLTLLTDLPAEDEEADALTGYFDQAFGQWCAYFDVDAARHADWHVRGHLMRSRERFEAAGLIPADLPAFANAYSRGAELWMDDQASLYYRRHLLLHEGTHCFMQTLLGGTGPPWYSEGTAELLATHRLEGGKLVLNDFPRAAEDVPGWGRIEIVRQCCAQRRAKTLADVFALRGTLHTGVEPYGWCWTAAALLDAHPRYRDRFRGLHRHVTEADFNRRVSEIFAEDRDRLREDWQLFVVNLDYGYDFRRLEVERSAGKPLAAGAATLSVAADRGWQSSGIAVARGETYRLRASGRYVVAQDEGEPWTSEPGGVTIRYHDGRPLGVLLAAIRPDDAEANDPSGLILPVVVGLGTTLEAKRSGTLYFRINDSAGGLADNSGTAEVEVSRQ